MPTPVPDAEPTARIESEPRRRVRAAEAQFAPGTVVAHRYRIAGILGAGGMGEVYRADDTKLDQPVALKFLPARLAGDANLLDRLHDEVRLGRRITHPNVCRIYDIAEADGAHFVAMEFVDGEDLARLLRRIGRLAHDKAVDITRGIAAGLHAAHVKGILHRDLKPANVMIDSHGEARIMDFGLALADEDDAQGGVIAGTPAYMAPEQLTGQPATIQSDLYALGLVMYELFTGRRAHAARTFLERKRELTSEIATPSSVVRDLDPAVERIILRCLSNDPSQRPRSAREVIDALPGGDPLAAALAAGETPSPRVVAAAGTEGTLKPAAALAILGSIAALFAVVFFVAARAGAWRMLHMEKPPEVHIERAGALLRGLGIPEQPFVSHGFDLNQRYNGWVFTNERTADLRTRYSRGLPLLSFWVREQSEPLISRSFSTVAVDKNDPPQHLPGASTVDLDLRGHLVDLTSIAAPAWTPRPLDWRPLFTAAGLDPARFTPAAPRLIPSSAADARAAWSGRHPEDGTPIRVEAAAWRGVPVFFRIVAPWDEVDLTGRVPFAGDRFEMAWLSVILAALGVGTFLAWRNLRLRRGDRAGALRAATVFFILGTISRLGAHDHHAILSHELEVLMLSLSQSFFFAALFALAYIAIEPYLRRRWPEKLIAWTRLLNGRWRDPMVGRDILIGTLLGMLHTTLATLDPLWRRFLTGRSEFVLPGEPFVLDSIGSAIGFAAQAILGGMQGGMALMLTLTLLTIVLRKRAVAVAAFWVLMLLVFSSASHEPSELFIFVPIVTLVAVTVARYGLLTSVMFLASFTGVFFDPRPDAMAWYTARGLIAPAVVLAIAVWAFRVALGDQKLMLAEE